MSLLVSVRLSERGRILSKYLIWRKFLCVIISVLTSPEGRGQGDKWRVSTMQSPRCHGGELSLLSLVTGVNKTRLSELIAHQSTGHGPAPKNCSASLCQVGHYLFTIRGETSKKQGYQQNNILSSSFKEHVPGRMLPYNFNLII